VAGVMVMGGGWLRANERKKNTTQRGMPSQAPTPRKHTHHPTLTFTSTPPALVQ
jgi:hypothetical protein